MSNDYPDSYKPIEGVPPPPKRFRGSINLREMVERLTPVQARSVLAFMESHGCTNQMPPDVIDALVQKTTLIEAQQNEKA